MLFFVFTLMKFSILTPADKLNLAFGCLPSYTETKFSLHNSLDLCNTSLKNKPRVILVWKNAGVSSPTGCPSFYFRCIKKVNIQGVKNILNNTEAWKFWWDWKRMFQVTQKLLYRIIFILLGHSSKNFILPGR